MKLTQTELAVALAAAAEADPHEAGGVLMGKGLRRRQLVSLPNATTDRNRYRPSPLDLQRAETDGWSIQAHWHSHVRCSIEPSQADLVACSTTALPWIIVGHPNGRQRTIHPASHKLPLIGREFVHGTIDCYTLIKDYYKQILAIELPDFERDDDWWLKGQNVYMDNLEAAGFRPHRWPETQPDQHDVILMKMNSPVPNHGAVYLGASRIMHHYQGVLSNRVFFGQYYQNRSAFIARLEK